MESADQGAPEGRHSLVVPRAAMRLVIRRGEATFSPMVGEAAALIGALHRIFPHGQVNDAGGLSVAFEPDLHDPSLDDEARLKAPSVLDAVRALAGLVSGSSSDATPPGVYGAFSYEIVDAFDSLPPRKPCPFDEPDATFVLALDTISYDHAAREVSVVTRAVSSDDDADAERRHADVIDLLTSSREAASESRYDHLGAMPERALEPDVTDEQFIRSVKSFLSHIAAGDIFQGVLSRGLVMKSEADPLQVYRALRERNPSPYMFFIDTGNGALLGASPETCVKVIDRQLFLRPIAGTAPRGFAEDGSIDKELDVRLAMALQLDAKEQAEHAMLVDLARNDVARVCIAGTRSVSNPLSIEQFSHVQHLVSRVSGELRPEFDALHAYRACANMGTLTGAPKLRAMELIRETEPASRGFYGGAVGYLLQNGDFDSCIVIRSLRYRDGVYITRTGAGVVAQSDPQRELDETTHKSRACRVAVALAEAAQ